MANLYEEIGDQDRSLQFALIAAHLAPQDAEEWARLADMSTELGDLEQAAACFRKAIDAEPDNMRYHLSRCSLLEQVRQKKCNRGVCSVLMFCKAFFAKFLWQLG